ncbi:Zinc finger protein 36, C3H1 type-like 2, partial [Ophiophagus hannah]
MARALTEKSLSNMLDKKAVGSPVGTSPSSNFTPGFLRRHSTSNLQALANGNIKFPSASLSAPSNFGSLKEPGTGAGGSSSSPTTALLNKENKFRDRSLSENGERSQHLMQQLHQQQVSAAGGGGGGGSCCPPPGPPASPPFSFQPLRRLSESPVFDAPPSPPDSLSDRESYLSGSLSSGSLSGSESPGLDSGRRLPIFSRLSISDD